MTGKRTYVFRAMILAGVCVLFVPPAVSQTMHCGNGMFGINYDDPQDPVSSVTTGISRIEDADIGWVRLVARWDRMETFPGVIDFQYLDDRVNAAFAEQRAILLTFYGIPSWANGSPWGCGLFNPSQGKICSTPPASSNYFRDFASRVAARYAAKIDYYEIWNEPDFPVFFNGSMWEFHTKIAQPGASAIRAADPGATILGPGILSSSTKLTNFLSSACSYIDIVTVHAYEGSAAGMKNSLSNKWPTAISAAGCTNRPSWPVWVTEFGIDSCQNGICDTPALLDRQANEYGQAASDLQNGQLRADKLFYYRISDTRETTKWHWGITTAAPGYGVPEPGYNPKPSLTRLKNVLWDVCWMTFP